MPNPGDGIYGTMLPMAVDDELTDKVNVFPAFDVLDGAGAPSRRDDEAEPTSFDCKVHITRYTSELSDEERRNDYWVETGSTAFNLLFNEDPGITAAQQVIDWYWHKGATYNPPVRLVTHDQSIPPGGENPHWRVSARRWTPSARS